MVPQAMPFFQQQYALAPQLLLLYLFDFFQPVARRQAQQKFIPKQTHSFHVGHGVGEGQHDQIQPSLLQLQQ